MMNRSGSTSINNKSSTLFDDKMIQSLSNLSKNVSHIGSLLPVQQNNTTFNDKFYDAEIEKIKKLIKQIQEKTQKINQENINRQSQMQMVILKLRQSQNWYDSQQFSKYNGSIVDLFKYISILVYKQQLSFKQLNQKIKQHKGQHFITIAHQFNYQDFLQSQKNPYQFSKLTILPTNFDKKLMPLIQWYNYFYNIYQNHKQLHQNQKKIEQHQIQIRKKKIEKQEMKLRRMINNNGNIQESKKRLSEISVTISKISSRIQERSKIN